MKKGKHKKQNRENTLRQVHACRFLAEAEEGMKLWKGETGKNLPELKKELDELIDKNTRKKKSGLLSILFFISAAMISMILAAPPKITPINTSGKFLAASIPFAHPAISEKGDESTSSSFQAYATENYKQAIYYYKKLAEQHPGHEKYRLLLGMSYLSNYQHQQAIEILSRPFENASWEADRQWFLALAYIKTNQTGEAKAMLLQLQVGESYYKSSAAELLQELDRHE